MVIWNELGLIIMVGSIMLIRWLFIIMVGIIKSFTGGIMYVEW